MQRSSQLLAALPRASSAASSLSARRTSRLATAYTQSRNIHNSPSNSATPLPHVTVPGAPPAPPQQHPTETQERLNRKRQQAESFLAGVNSRPSAGKPVSILRKRFWKNVSVKETDKGLEVYLDARAVKTAAKESLVLPLEKRALATCIILHYTYRLAHKQDNSAQLPPDISIVDIMRVLDLSPLLGLMQNLQARRLSRPLDAKSLAASFPRSSELLARTPLGHHSRCDQ